MQNYLSFIAAALYVVCLFLSSQRMRLALGLTVFAWCLHGLALSLTLFSGDAIRVGFAVMYSSALWVSTLIYIIENRNFNVDSLRPLVLPHAALSVLLPVFFTGQLISLEGKTSMFPWHMTVAILAYSTLTMAAFHAFIMYFQDRRLHKLSANQELNRFAWFDKAIDRLPAVLKMERILFVFIFIGFVFLTLTVLSGVVFSEQVLGVAFTWDHKTIFSLFSWLLFAVLLIGRQWKGWRGKTILRMTLFAFLSLLMAYAGSRFVLEVLLHRSVS